MPRAWKKTASFPEFPSSSLMNAGDHRQLAGASTRVSAPQPGAGHCLKPHSLALGTACCRGARDSEHFPSSGRGHCLITPPRLLQICILKRKQSSAEELQKQAQGPKSHKPLIGSRLAEPQQGLRHVVSDKSLPSPTASFLIF